MVRNAMADENLLSYLGDVSKQNKFNIGLILGQHCLGKDYIIHLAKTPPLESEGNNVKQYAQNISEVDENWVADHAKHAARMLPGGMYILGIFLVSQDDLLNPMHQKIKSTLLKVHKELESIKYLFGNANNEKLVISYNTVSQKYVCKSYDIVTSTVNVAECKFMAKANKWLQMECNYELDHLYQIKAEELHWPLKKHMTVILDKVAKQLKNSIFLYDGEYKDEEDSVENIGKKKKTPKSQKSNHDIQETNSKPILVSIFENCTWNSGDEDCPLFEINESGGQIKIVGQVVSKLWLNPKITIAEAGEAVYEDIMRSLTSRLEMHWDSLTEEEHSEDVNSIHEPPRRVLVALPHSNITLSDYLFPGEGPSDAQSSLEEMLDIKISDVSSIQDVEGQADTLDYYKENMESESEEVIPKLQNTQKLMYSIGIGVAVFVLIFSFLVHLFLKQSSK